MPSYTFTEELVSMNRKLALSFVLCLIAFNLLVAQSSPKANTDKSKAASPWVGEWKLDLSQSTIHGPAPKQETLVVDEVSAARIKYSITTTGETSKYSTDFEGKPDTAGDVLVDGKKAGSATYHRVSAQEYTGKSTMGDNMGLDETITLSPDHKKITITIHAKGPQGEYDETAVYTR